MRRCPPPLLAACLLAAAPALHAQVLSGTWTMDTTVDLPQDGGTCVYAGDCRMHRDGDDLSGTVDLTLVSGPAECPKEMTAALDGIVEGDSVAGTLSGGELGMADFDGDEGNSLSGAFTATAGPFAGSSGTWSAQRQSVLAIPTLAGVGLAVLALALLAGGGWMLRRPRHPV
jgi:hypothetical protein